MCVRSYKVAVNIVQYTVLMYNVWRGGPERLPIKNGNFRKLALSTTRILKFLQLDVEIN